MIIRDPPQRESASYVHIHTRTQMKRIVTFSLVGALASVSPRASVAQTPGTPPDEHTLGDLVITGSQLENVTKLAVLKSYSPDYEDVVVRSVVRHDLELSGMFDVIPDSKAPSASSAPPAASGTPPNKDSVPSRP